MTRYHLAPVLALAIAAGLCLTARGAETLTADRIIASVRAATGADRLAAVADGVRFTGATTFLGNAATTEALVHADGRSVFSIRAPVGQSGGFDGQTVWSIDLGGEFRRLSLREREESIFEAGILAHRWFATGSTLDYTVDTAASDESRIVLAFDREHGLVKGFVAIDRATWMPVSYTESGGEGTTTWTIGGSHELGGMKLPASLRRVTPSGTDDTYTFAAVEPVTSAEAYRIPARAKDEVRFDAEAPAQLELKKAPTGHLLVRVMLDGEDPNWFIFDTGAGANVLANSTMERRGYKSIATVPAVGVGGAASASFIRAKSLTVGRAMQSDPLFACMDLAMLDPIMGEHIAGIVGYGMLARTIAVIDAAAGRVELHNPASYTLPEGASWMPLIDYERHPCIIATMEGHQGAFKIDTGAAGSFLTVHAPAVQRLNLLDGRETKPSRLGGVGGFVPARTGEIKTFELAGVRFDGMSVSFATEPKGAFADVYTLGNIGGRALERFIMVLDYPSGRIALIEKK